MTWDPKKDDIYREFGMKPDSELLLWEEWATVRREEAIKLGEQLGKPPVDLIMHGLEDARVDKERKTVLEEAQIAMKPAIEDSNFAKTTRLKQRCPCANVYDVHQTSLDLGFPTVIEHVRCPDYIRETEKGLIGITQRVPCNKINSDYLKYRNDREKILKDEIEKFDPYRPDMRELVVIGHRPKTPPKKIPPLPYIQVTEPPEPCNDSLRGVYALRINNTIVCKHIPDQSVPELQRMQKEPWHEFCYSWTYYFNVPEKKIGRSKLYLENLGTVALRYCWKKIKKMIPYIPEEVYEQKFFFYKNEDVICPGQNKTINFTFVSDRAGIFKESWELSIMNICLFDSLNDKFVMYLVGDVVENLKNISKKVDKLQMRINGKANEKFIFGLLNNLVIEATSPKYQIYPYKKLLLEIEMFLAKNPVCFYHQTEVQKLKDLFKEMTNKEWDLSITTWREAMIAKEFDERMMYFDILKNSFSVLLTPWSEAENVQVMKHRAIKLLLGQLLDKFYFERNSVALWNGVETMSAGDASNVKSPLKECPLALDVVQNIFYVRMYKHVQDFIETCAGVISSIDLNRWIDFDFCQM